MPNDGFSPLSMERLNKLNDPAHNGEFIVAAVREVLAYRTLVARAFGGFNVLREWECAHGTPIASECEQCGAGAVDFAAMGER